MQDIEYKEFYDKVGKINGWDFSKLQVLSEGVKWDFYEEVKKRSKRSDVLLDIGTGGGENVLRIASSFLFIIGIDNSRGILKTAYENLKISGALNVRFAEMSSDTMQFPESFFDMISSRHAPFSAEQVAKVLKRGGTFITQQVSEADKINLKRAFGRGQSFEEVDGTLKEKYILDLKCAGFSEIQVYDYDATEYYQREEDLLFLLNHTPIIPAFGRDKKDFEILHNFIENNRTEKGICTNSKRFMLIARK